MELALAADLKLLLAGVVLGLAHLIAAAASSTLQRGVKVNLGNREGAPPLTGAAHRLDRAFANYRESFPFFAAAMIVAHLAGKADGPAIWGAAVWLIARAVYLPIYGLGIPLVRTLFWIVSFVALLMILAALVV